MTAGTRAHEVLYDGLYTFAGRVVNVGLSVALGVLTARLLGPAGKGLYAMPAVQAGLAAIAFGGLSDATSYFLLNKQAGRRIVVPIALAALLFLVGATVAVLAIAILSRALWAAPAAIASLPAAAALNVLSGYIIGIKRIRYATTLTFATKLATLSLMLVGLFLVARSAWVAIVVWLVSSTLVAAIGLLIMVAHARTLEFGSPVDTASFIRFALKSGTGYVVTLLNYRADLYVVAVLLTTFDLGLYTVAVGAAETLLVPTQIAATVTSPHIGGLERAAAARLTARCVRNNLLIAVIVCATLIAIAPMVVNLLYGPAFLPLIPSLRILLVGVVALSLGSPISSYYVLKLGKPEVPLTLASISATLCIASSIVLVPRIGIAGAAFASTIAYVVSQALTLAYFSRGTHIGPRLLLLPTADDLRLYYDFARRVRRDGVQILDRLIPSVR